MTLSLSVADDRLGAYFRRTTAIADRLGKSLDFDEVMEALQRIHDGKFGSDVLHVGDFPVSLECEVGGKSKDQLLSELKAADCYVSDYAKDIMGKDAWKPGEKEVVKFARVTVRELGFIKNPTTTQVWARIKDLGHVLCEPCDGAAIRLAYKGQKKGDYFWCAMEQISDSVGNPDVFRVNRDGDGKRWLDSGWVGPTDGWDLARGVVFRLRE